MGVVMECLVSARLADPGGRRRMERRIAELTGHVVGAGQQVRQLEALIAPGPRG